MDRRIRCFWTRHQGISCMLTHCGLVASYGDRDLGQHLARVMACCLMAPSQYLNQCWLMISEVLWHPPDINVAEKNLFIVEISLKLLIWESNPPGANELKSIVLKSYECALTHNPAYLNDLLCKDMEHSNGKTWKCVMYSICKALISSGQALSAPVNPVDCVVDTYVIWLSMHLVVLYQLLLFCSLSNMEIAWS